MSDRITIEAPNEMLQTEREYAAKQDIWEVQKPMKEILTKTELNEINYILSNCTRENALKIYTRFTNKKYKGASKLKRKELNTRLTLGIKRELKKAEQGKEFAQLSVTEKIKILMEYEYKYRFDKLILCTDEELKEIANELKVANQDSVENLLVEIYYALDELKQEKTA